MLTPSLLNSLKNIEQYYQALYNQALESQQSNSKKNKKAVVPEMMPLKNGGVIELEVAIDFVQRLYQGLDVLLQEIAIFQNINQFHQRHYKQQQQQQQQQQQLSDDAYLIALHGHLQAQPQKKALEGVVRAAKRNAIVPLAAGILLSAGYPVACIVIAPLITDPLLCQLIVVSTCLLAALVCSMLLYEGVKSYLKAYHIEKILTLSCPTTLSFFPACDTPERESSPKAQQRFA
jgi:hypothetical protein